MIVLWRAKEEKNEKERPHLLALINLNANDLRRFVVSPYLHSSPFSLCYRRSTFIICVNCLFICFLHQFPMRLCELTSPSRTPGVKSRHLFCENICCSVILVSYETKPANQMQNWPAGRQHVVLFVQMHALQLDWTVSTVTSLWSST